jgi:hypothetical protein
MRDRRLGEAERLGQMADARLALGLRLDETQDAEPGRIGEDTERLRQYLGVMRRQTGGIDRRLCPNDAA